ncbi:sulfurtransferase [Herbaspirillum seropedicae]|uniref:Sulfurtransferase n=1 Tax=Herbaspirillum seropedicae (strain SmR1) TaxID=757424 RepID=D8IRX1_HERSS|nr:sulfurtransferase [Herbaspirillum seropedicae]ADJ65314.1 thiosulfate sulfurtransferase (rhodanese) protein [Herbaspirillum seropedicae SmR1]AKN67161.1 3-mercaptopyruvate sulfurtransferase [Herbaspirillum seropedicae]NQE30238.1 3-mercaptopyruvate sulfurtransferase [Herbaspirillum seropedicae]UMU23168.1 sulfurtransferase [Herbaspirillum seropedicae]
MIYQTLISASELKARAAHINLVIVDCRHDLANPDFGRQAYAAGHLPQARFAHLDELLSGPKTDAAGRFHGRHPLPDRQQFVQAMRALGINNDTQVVAYDAHGGMFAARLWWLLRWIGHSDVAVLDGGMAAWQAIGEPLSAETPAPATPGSIQDLTSLVQTVDAQALVENIKTQALQVIDARAPDRFRGENETLDAVGGHIPGAKNRFFKDNLQADGRFKGAAQLREEWLTLLGDPQAAVMQCGSGVTACHNLLALEVAGLAGARLYPGSWSEWSSNPQRPVATGS